MKDNIHDLQRLHDELRSGFFEGNRYELIHRFGNAGFVEARHTVEGFLQSSDPQLRYIALNVLVLHWGIAEHHDTCIRMLAEDPDADVRRLAASCAGTLFRATKSADALRLLLGIVSKEEEDAYVRESAYSAILEILGVPVAELPSDRLKWPSDIDWSKLREAQAIVDQSYAS